jgi:hypothetical protein
MTSIFAKCCERTERLHLIVKGAFDDGPWLLYARIWNDTDIGEPCFSDKPEVIQIGNCPCCGVELDEKTPTFAEVI